MDENTTPPTVEERIDRLKERVERLVVLRNDAPPGDLAVVLQDLLAIIKPPGT